MHEDFSEYVIKGYKYWSLMVHGNQEYLGRCVVWLGRADAQDLTEVSEAEYLELFEILKEAKAVLAKTFQPDLFNYAFLGNKTRHLHCHIVPRYRAPREFMGLKFEDKLWGHNYCTDHDFVTPPEILEAIKATLKTSLQT